MNLPEAKDILNGCTREELRDHAFGDAEVFWLKDNKQVANGYFGGQTAVVGFDDIIDGNFQNEEARELRNCGTEGHVERNDEAGPAEYAEGNVMLGLTIEGVRRELTGE